MTKNNSDAYDFFLGGVIQGSADDESIRTQDYRERIKEIVAEKIPGRTVYCPYSTHNTGIEYEDKKADRVFRDHIDLATQCRFFIAYASEASMGTAIEMWECHRAGVPIIAITPLTHNWVVRILSSVVLGDLDAFDKWLSEENLSAMISGRKRPSPSAD